MEKLDFNKYFDTEFKENGVGNIECFSPR